MIWKLSDMTLQASFLSWVGEMFTEESLAAMGAILMLYLGYVIKKEILPLLRIKRNCELASYILVIADDVTDYFRLKFPDAHWSVWLDLFILIRTLLVVFTRNGAY